MTLVSVIVPVYNIEKYLIQCTNSIRNQTHRNLEIILVNDGSTDGSGDICSAISLLDERVKVVHQENLGASEARNSGLNQAQGEFICFVDGDDQIHSRMIEVLFNEFSVNPALDVATCELTVFKEDFDRHFPLGHGKSRLLIGDESLCELLYQTIINGPFAKLFRSHLFDHIKFPKNIKIGEDLLTNIQLFSNTSLVSAISDGMYGYCKRESSAMSRVRLNDRLRLIEELEKLTGPRLTSSQSKAFSSRIFAEALFASVSPSPQGRYPDSLASTPLDNVFHRHKRVVAFNSKESERRRILAFLAFISPKIPRAIITLMQHRN